MGKMRCAIDLYQICLIVTHCHIITTVSQPGLVDCGELQQCIRDPQNNDYCYLFNNASRNDLAIRKTIDIHSPILYAETDDQAVKVYWNTTNIILEIPKDYRRANSLDVRVVYQNEIATGQPRTPIHINSYSIRLTGHVIQTGENRQIILNCSVVGIHNTNTVLEFRFNDDKSYSCRKKKWPYEPEDNRDKPHAHLLDDNTTCQLLIPNAIITHLEDYYCRVELWIWPEEGQSSCYLLSKTVTLSEASITDTIREHKSHTTIIIITIPAAIVLTLLLLIVAVVVVVVKTVKYRCQHGQQGVIDEMIGNPGFRPQDAHEENPGVNGHNFNDEENDEGNEFLAGRNEGRNHFNNGNNEERNGLNESQGGRQDNLADGSSVQVQDPIALNR